MTLPASSRVACEVLLRMSCRHLLRCYLAWESIPCIIAEIIVVATVHVWIWINNA